MRCARIDCGDTGFGCIAHNCPRTPIQTFLSPTPSPRFLPVNIPFSNFGVTTVTMDRDGNVSIKVDQVIPDPVSSPSERGNG